MTPFVALFRGINVGGKHIVPMKDLRELLRNIGCEEVQTYIQSGNAVFASAMAARELSAAISPAISERFGFEPTVLVLPARRFREVAEANPYKALDVDPKLVHVAFLAEKPRRPDVAALEKLQSPSEKFELHDDAFYLFAPDGIARSELVAKLDRALGVAVTSRNWRTVTRLLGMLP